MKVLSLFSGIGAFEKALDRLNIDYELVAFSEIDKYATKSYCAIHGVDESMNLGDITKVDENSLPKDIDLITYGFPCQDISLAGKQKGMFNDDGTQTRSGLFFEALRIIEATKPKIAIAENVKNLTGKKFKEQFELVLKSLEEAGYSNYWKVLNAKDYGIPQNRERVFIISIRKDIDRGYEFPEPFPLQLRLKDMLDDEVDEKFYLNSTKEYFIKHSFESEEKGNGFRFAPHVKKNANISKTVTTRAGGRMDDNFVMDIDCEENTFKFDSTNKMIQVGQMYGTEKEPNPQAGRIYDADGISPTMDTCSGGNRMPKVLIEGTVIDDTQGFDGTRYYDNVSPSLRASRSGLKVVTDTTTKDKHDNEESNKIMIDEVKRIVGATRKCDIGVTVHDNGDIRPHRLDKKKSGISEMQINKDTNISNTVTASHMPKTYGDSTDFRIRKLTPKECWCLMGFDDEDLYKAEAVNSNAQLYKQAGNSIVVNVLEALFINLRPYMKG